MKVAVLVVLSAVPSPAPDLPVPELVSLPKDRTWSPAARGTGVQGASTVGGLPKEINGMTVFPKSRRDYGLPRVSGNTVYHPQGKGDTQREPHYIRFTPSTESDISSERQSAQNAPLPSDNTQDRETLPTVPQHNAAHHTGWDTGVDDKWDELPVVNFAMSFDRMRARSAEIIADVVRVIGVRDGDVNIKSARDCAGRPRFCIDKPLNGAITNHDWEVGEGTPEEHSHVSVTFELRQGPHSISPSSAASQIGACLKPAIQFIDQMVLDNLDSMEDGAVPKCRDLRQKFFACERKANPGKTEWPCTEYLKVTPLPTPPVSVVNLNGKDRHEQPRAMTGKRAKELWGQLQNWLAKHTHRREGRPQSSASSTEQSTVFNYFASPGGSQSFEQWLTTQDTGTYLIFGLVLGCAFTGCILLIRMICPCSKEPGPPAVFPRHQSTLMPASWPRDSAYHTGTIHGCDLYSPMSSMNMGRPPSHSPSGVPMFSPDGTAIIGAGMFVRDETMAFRSGSPPPYASAGQHGVPSSPKAGRKMHPGGRRSPRRFGSSPTRRRLSHDGSYSSGGWSPSKRRLQMGLEGLNDDDSLDGSISASASQSCFSDLSGDNRAVAARDFVLRRKMGEKLGIKWVNHTTLLDVIPGSPADRQGLGDYLGWKATHINNVGVQTLGEIQRTIQGVTTITITLAPSKKKSEARSAGGSSACPAGDPLADAPWDGISQSEGQPFVVAPLALPPTAGASKEMPSGDRAQNLPDSSNPQAPPVNPLSNPPQQSASQLVVSPLSQPTQQSPSARMRGNPPSHPSTNDNQAE